MILVVLCIFKLKQVPEQQKKTKTCSSIMSCWNRDKLQTSVTHHHQLHLQEGDSISLLDHSGVEAQGWERQTSLQQWQWSEDSPPKWQCDCESSLFLLLFCLCWGFGSSLWALLFYFVASHLKDSCGEFSASLRRGIFAALFVSLFAFQRDFAKATRINLLEEKKGWKLHFDGDLD